MSGERRPLPTFPSSAPGELADAQLRANLRKATGTIRAKRAQVAAETPDWEGLREAARAIKEEALANLDGFLTQLEEAVGRAGGTVHRARDAEEANRIIGGLVEAALASSAMGGGAEAGARSAAGTGGGLEGSQGEGAGLRSAADDPKGETAGVRTASRDVPTVVKVKSITTDEVGLNRALASRGIRAVETDLAELIIQLAGESSSHFLVPAIHKNRTQIRDLFREHLGRPDLGDEPAELAEAARLHLRREFLEAEVAVSGANFAVAETGTVGVVESEGNGRMCLTLPRVLITLMGVEKVLPRFQDLEIFLQLLPRSATGERMNPYTTFWTGVTPGDGPQEFHLVLLDNGRSRVLADPVGRQALHCIRCSACLNACPVYERVGGHAYHAPYPGPIGSILMPQLLGPGVHDSLPFASTLCGACADVCPVKIDIPRVLLHLRGRVVEGEAALARGARAAGVQVGEVVSRGRGGSFRTLGGSFQERWLMRGLGWLFRHPGMYRWSLALARLLQRRLARDVGSEASGGGRPGPCGGTGGMATREAWIQNLPGYAAGWTLGRDVPPLPPRSFREWWDLDRSG
jgi:L-lactate dehydrogenase complex protein LldF